MALQKFSGFIDIHVHLREPGATQKEDFSTGSHAAAKGGFTFVCDMPNNYATPTFTEERLDEKVRLSKEKSLIDIGFHFGTDGNNLDQFPYAQTHTNVFGLKVYCGETTGNLMVSDHAVLDHIFAAWESEKPILVHAEGDILAFTLELAQTYNRRIHVCHVTGGDIEAVRHAKEQHIHISVGVTPHHLFLTDENVSKLGPYGLVKPPIGDMESQSMLWEALHDGVIDIVESDHSPHTKEEKESGKPFYGMPGLETTVGLLCRAVKEERLKLSDMVRLLYDNPKKIFSIPNQSDTFIELDPDKPFIVGTDGYETKSKWSPFDGWELYGKVEKVILYGKSIY